MLVMELVCVCKEGESSLEKRMFIQSHSSHSASHSFLPSLLYGSHGVAGGNFWFSFESSEEEKAKTCGQDEVGQPFTAVSWSPL